MSFFQWYQKVAVAGVVEIVKNFVVFVVHYFSILRLGRTLLSPWKRQVADKSKGWSLGQALNEASFDLISRVVGAAVRSVVIVAGVLVLIVVTVIVSLSGAVVLALPILLVPYWLSYAKVREEFSRSRSYPEIVEAVVRGGFYHFFVSRTGVDENKLKDVLLGLKMDKNGLLKEAGEFAKGHGHDHVTDVAVMRSMIRGDKGASDFLREHQIKLEDVERLVVWYHQILFKEKRSSEFWRREYLLSMNGVGKAWDSGYTNRLDEFCEDLSRQDLRWFPFVGREELVRRLTGGLIKAAEPNVLLYGPPGVGRHSLIRGLAKMIQWHEIPELLHRRVLVFRSEKFLAESGKREASESMYQLLREAEAAGNVILVFDNFDELIGVGSESHDLGKVFEEKLESGKVQVIALTSTRAYLDKVKQNQSVRKLFSPIELKRMSSDEVWPVLFDQVGEVEPKSRLHFSYQSLKEIVEDSEKYQPGDPFPEKALDLVDELVTYAKSRGAKEVSLDDVDAVMSVRSRVPIGKMQEGERQVLLKVEEALKEQIVEQDEAIDKIAKALRRARAGVKTGQKPVGSFLFLGPTGVGKTETAKVLSRKYFQTEEFIRFDMAEFQTADGVARLIGSSRRKDPGLLAKRIGERPYGVLLLDEFEKAPKEVHNIFLSILDEGSFSSADGGRVYCNNLMVVATSNAGSEEMREYLAKNRALSGFESYMTEFLLKNRLFAPELLNRFDAVVFYKPLSAAGLKRVTGLILKRVVDKLKEEKDVEVEFGEGLVEEILEKGYDANFGARSIQRYVADTVQDEIAKKLLANPDVKRVRV